MLNIFLFSLISFLTASSLNERNGDAVDDSDFLEAIEERQGRIIRNGIDAEYASLRGSTANEDQAPSIIGTATISHGASETPSPDGERIPYGNTAEDVPSIRIFHDESGFRVQIFPINDTLLAMVRDLLPGMFRQNGTPDYLSMVLQNTWLESFSSSEYKTCVSDKNPEQCAKFMLKFVSIARGAEHCDYDTELSFFKRNEEAVLDGLQRIRDLKASLDGGLVEVTVPVFAIQTSADFSQRIKTLLGTTSLFDACVLLHGHPESTRSNAFWQHAFTEGTLITLENPAASLLEAMVREQSHPCKSFQVDFNQESESLTTLEQFIERTQAISRAAFPQITKEEAEIVFKDLKLCFLCGENDQTSEKFAFARLPCGDTSACMHCIQEIIKRNKKPLCPFCRIPITHPIQIYRPAAGATAARDSSSDDVTKQGGQP